jgi:AcrR family transcriptional regulator
MVEAILQAAAELFASLGYARTTTNKIAERAGVSVGSLYQYFPNKDSLLARLLEKHHADVHRVVGESLERLADPNAPLEATLRQLLTALVEVHEEDPELTRALSSAVLRESPASDAMHKEDDAQFHYVVEVLERRPDVRAGNRAAMALVLGQTTAHLTRWLVHDAPSQLSPALLEEMVQLLARFLRADQDACM